ncbi:ATP-binding protein [Pseudonocardia asaccharolytica]|uniref:ATP-binding protein n=2 Tax=Pseudonocardia asaccharolytica TaxID=54010 RepID=UPI00049172EC|nr:AAA family ATPase [Pseudonocardia asaccharolytica]
MSTAIRLRLLGPFTVEGELSAPVPTGKARRALAMLAERRGEFVSVGTLVDALWDGDAPERADRNVAVLISRLRRALGRERIDGSAAGYRLVPDDVDIDLHEATELVETAEFELAHGRYALASTSAEHAAKLLDADVALAGERDGVWVDELRRAVWRLLRRARVCWSAAALELGAHDTAVEVASAALRDDPFDEEVCRIVMLGHQEAGRSGAALVAYRSLRLAMSEQLGSDPSPATQAVFLSVLRSEHPAAPRRAARHPAAEPGGPFEDIVGREAELTALRELWAGAAAGRPALAVIVGEPGIGKSALVRAFAAEPRRTGGLALNVSCFEAERSLYLQPLVDAVRAVVHRMSAHELRELAGTRLGTLVCLVPELSDLVGEIPYARAGPELEHRRSLDALAGFLVRLSGRQPVLLVIEDMQHAGRSTVEALHLLAGRWAGSRSMVVLTERTSDDPTVTDILRDVSVWFELGPLSRADVTTLVERSRLGYDAERLYAWTGGSPLFLTELLRHPPASRGAVTIPRSLHGAVAERIAHAGEAVGELLSQGAVLGETFSLDGVAELSGLGVEDCARRAGRALRAGLLVTQGESFRFANDIVRKVAYESVAEPVRISRHRRAAMAPATRPEAAARHLAAALDRAGAARAWLAAANAAHLASAHTDAEQLLCQSVEAARTAGDRSLLAVALMRRGRARCNLARHADARADHEEALALAREIGDFELEARALEQLGWTALYARDALGAVDLAEQATDLAESAAAAPGAVPTAMLLLGRVRHWDGDYAGAGAAYEQVLDAEPGETTTALALAYRGALLQHLDRFAEARSVLARAAVLCRRVGEFRPLLQTLFFTALARGDSGDFAGALRALDNARRLIDAENVGIYRAGIETTTSWIWQELGQLARAREHAEEGVRLARLGGGALELEQELHAQLAIADCDLLLGRDDDAAAAVAAAAPMLERSLPFKPRAALRLLEMRARWDPGLAEVLLTEARSHSSAKYAALALDHLGRPAEAAALASSTGSDLLVAQLGPPAARRSAIARIVDALPAELRESFIGGGRLTVGRPRTS